MTDENITQTDSLPNANYSIGIDRMIRNSGLLAYLSPECLQTLVALLTFADGSGRCELSARIMAQTLNLSENQARKRLNKLCSITWQGKPLVTKEDGRAYGKFLSVVYRVVELDGISLTPMDKAEVRNCNDDGSGVGKPNHNGSSDDGSSVEGEVANKDAIHHPIDEECASSSAPPVVTGECNDMCVVNNINKHNTTQNESGISDVRKRIYHLLMNTGVSENIASELLARYPAERIVRQLRMLPFRNAKEPAAMLVKAIREDWSAPAAYIVRQRDESVKKAKAESEIKEEEARRTWQRQIEEAKSRISPEELGEITRIAKEKVSGELMGVFHGDAPEILVRTEINRIIAKKYLHEKRK